MKLKKSYVLSKLPKDEQNFLEKLEDVSNYLNTDNEYFIGNIKLTKAKSIVKGLELVMTIKSFLILS